jgi:hypothetical protein
MLILGRSDISQFYLHNGTVCCGCDCNCLKTLYTFEHVTRRLCFALNTKRNNILKTLLNNRRKGL